MRRKWKNTWSYTLFMMFSWIILAGSESNPAPTSSTVPPQTPSDTDFIIGPEDVLIVSVWKNAELYQECTVLPDGSLALKLLGEVVVQGLTVPALRQLLTERYREFIPEADISVTIKEMNSYKIYVLGRVAKPGEYKVRSQISALQALALAGGFSPYAKVKSIKVFRKEGKQDRILTFNYSDVVEGNAGDILLRAGDRLVVP